MARNLALEFLLPAGEGGGFGGRNATDLTAKKLNGSETLAPVCEHETLSGGDTRWGGGGLQCARQQNAWDDCGCDGYLETLMLSYAQFKAFSFVYLFVLGGHHGNQDANRTLRGVFQSSCDP